MGMPIIVEIADGIATQDGINKVFDYFKYVDEKFSVFKKDSEITKINNGQILEKDYSRDMEEIMKLSEQTKKETNGYFDIIDNNRKYNPSGIVKGWAIYNAAELLIKMGYENFYVDAGGDIQVHGKNEQKSDWKIGIKNPFKMNEIIKVVYLDKNQGIATSGTYIRGQHIYNPKDRKEEMSEIVSLSVIGPNVYEADRFATAAFAMQREGINFIEKLNGFEAYMIDKNGIATMTSNFEKYTKQ
jgi:thiamine biosynthesis lipoprotein